MYSHAAYQVLNTYSGQTQQKSHVFYNLILIGIQGGSSPHQLSTLPRFTQLRRIMLWIASNFNAYVWNLEKWYRGTGFQGRNRDADIENGHVHTAGRVGQTGKWVLTYIHYDVWNSSGNLLYGTGSSAQCSVMTLMGRKCGWGVWGGPRGRRYMCTYGWLTSLLGSGRSPGEGNGNRLQYCCLENPTDRGNWQHGVHGVAKSWTRLSD